MVTDQARTTGASADRMRYVRLGSHAVCFVLMLMAIVHQGTRTFVYPGWNTDKMLQAAVAVNIAEGHGVGYWYVSPDNLGERRLLPLYQWPPGYSLLLAVPYWFTADMNVSAWIVDWLAAVLYFGSWWFIVREMGSNLSWWGRLIFWLLSAATLIPLQDASAGVLALALFSAGLACALRATREGPRFLWLAAASGLCVGLSGWMRYAYWPLAAGLPLALGYVAWRSDNRLWRAALVQGGVCACVLGTLIGFQKWNTGNTTYLSVYYASSDARGLWPEQLLTVVPFPAMVFGCDRNLGMSLGAVDASVTLSLKWVLAAVVLLVFAVELVRHAGCRSGPDGAVAAVLYVTGAITIVSTLAMLGYLSVRYCPPGLWSYLSEVRYYCPTLIFLSLALCTWGLREGVFTGGWRGGLRLLLVIGFLWFPVRVRSTARTAWHDWKVLRATAPHQVRYGGDFDEFAQLLADHCQGAEHVAFLEDPATIKSGRKYAMAAIKGIGYTGHHERGFYLKLQTKEKVRVLAMSAPMSDDLTPFQQLLRSHDAQVCAYFAPWNLNLYAFDLLPSDEYAILVGPPNPAGTPTSTEDGNTQADTSHTN